MTKGNIIFLIICLFAGAVQAQEKLTLVQGEGIFTSSEVFLDDEGIVYAKEYNITVSNHFLTNTKKKSLITSRDVAGSFSLLKEKLTKLETELGLVNVSRTFPEKEIGKTNFTNKRGEAVSIHDYSKVFTLSFEFPVSYEVLKKELREIQDIIAIDYPMVIIPTGNPPNDTFYSNQYGLKLINAEDVFSLTEGNPDIILGFTDDFGANSANGVHEDLAGRVVDAESGRKYVDAAFNHGTSVAMVAAASTNNGKGVASLGGNFKLVFEKLGNPDYILSICTSTPPANANCPDVVNMSWVGSYNSITANVIEDLLDLGVVMVSASVNDIWWDPDSDGLPDWPGQTTLGQPFRPFPAYLNFPAKGTQVISVTATQLTDTNGSLDPSTGIDPFLYEERFRFEKLGTPDEGIFNYGLSNDPVASPGDAFTDIAAPGAYYFGTRGQNATQYGNVWGATSNAAPHVTATVGMMLSVNPSLTPAQVYEILTETANYDDIVVPPGSVTNTLPDGRKYNKYIGFGRLDAYEAVKHALPEPASYTISSNTTFSSSIRLKSDLTVQAGAKLTIPSNVAIVADPGVYIKVYGTLEADGATFTSMSSTWGGIIYYSGSHGHVKNSTIENVHSYGGAALSISTNNTMYIQGNTIMNVTGAASGISLSNASNVYIYENHIENTSYDGVYSTYSNAKIFNNFIKNPSNAGVQSTSYSSVVLSGVTSPYYAGENSIIGGKYGLQIGNASYLNAGNSSSFASQNRVANQSGSGWAHIYSTSYYSNTAQYNFFKPYNGSGGVAPTVSGWGSVNYTPYLTSDPDPGAGFKRMSEELSEENIQLQKAITHRLNGEFDEAKLTLDALLSTASSEKVIEQSLFEFGWIVQESGNQTLLTAFEEYQRIFSNTDLEASAKMMLAMAYYNLQKFDKALALTEAVIHDFEGTDHALEAAFLGAYISADAGYLHQFETYYEQLSVFKFKSPDNFKLLALSHYIETNTEQNLEFDELNISQEIPESINLYNYPNPFNPTTNIRFDLPVDNHVELVVFDILGRKVAELLNEFRTQGTHSIPFDASSLSSGVYLYQLRMNNQIVTKQMMLIK